MVFTSGEAFIFFFSLAMVTGVLVTALLYGWRISNKSAVILAGLFISVALAALLGFAALLTLANDPWFRDLSLLFSSALFAGIATGFSVAVAAALLKEYRLTFH